MKRIKSANQMFLFTILCYIAIGFLIRDMAMPLNLYLVMGEILAATPVLVWCIAKRKNPLRQVPRRGLKPSVAVLLVIFAYCMLPCMALINLISMLFTTNYLVNTVNAAAVNPLIVNLFFLAFIPSVVEELIFRGIYYHTYRKNGIWMGVFLSGLLFGLMHMNFNQFMYAIVMGMVFAVLIEVTGSLLAPMVVHFVFNANSVVLNWLMRGVQTAVNGRGMLNTMAPIGLTEILVSAIVLFFFALAGAGLCVAILLAVSKISKTEAHMAGLFLKRKGSAAADDGGEHEKTADVYLISAIVLCFGYMLYLNIK